MYLYNFIIHKDESGMTPLLNIGKAITILDLRSGKGMDGVNITFVISVVYGVKDIM